DQVAGDAIVAAPLAERRGQPLKGNGRQGQGVAVALNGNGRFAGHDSIASGDLLDVRVTQSGVRVSMGRGPAEPTPRVGADSGDEQQSPGSPEHRRLGYSEETSSSSS